MTDLEWRSTVGPRSYAATIIHNVMSTFRDGRHQSFISVHRRRLSTSRLDT